MTDQTAPEAVQGPYEILKWMGGTAIVAKAPDGVDPNAKGGQLRIADAVHVPDLPDGISDATMALLASAWELREVARAALEWIDAVPKETVLPPMPGFSRDWADLVLAQANGKAPIGGDR